MGSTLRLYVTSRSTVRRRWSPVAAADKFQRPPLIPMPSDGPGASLRPHRTFWRIATQYSCSAARSLAYCAQISPNYTVNPENGSSRTRGVAPLTTAHLKRILLPIRAHTACSYIHDDWSHAATTVDGIWPIIQVNIFTNLPLTHVASVIVARVGRHAHTAPP